MTVIHLYNAQLLAHLSSAPVVGTGLNMWVYCAPMQCHRHSTTTSERRHLLLTLMMTTMTPEPALPVPGVDPALKTDA